MVEKLIEWSARNPFLIGLATLALLFGGIDHGYGNPVLDAAQGVA